MAVLGAIGQAAIGPGSAVGQGPPAGPTRFGEPVPRIPGIPGGGAVVAEPRGPGGEGPDGDRAEADRDYPPLGADPFRGSAIDPGRRDRFLFPRLVNLIVEDEWDLDDPEAARAEVFRRRARADIRAPGPDTANFPNAAFTLPKGRAYVETSPLGLIGPSDRTAPQYNWEFLVRYGVTDNLEFRVFSNGYTRTFGPKGTSGFSPLAFDLKVNFWDENPDYFLPAFGLEAYIQTDLGSPAFNGGTQPSLNLLFDHSLPLDIQLEYNFSMSGVQVTQGLNDFVFGFQWSLQRDLWRDFAVFTHGFYNASALPRLPVALEPTTPGEAAGAPTTVVVGGGAVWTANDRLSIFGSYNAGLGRSTPTTIALLGFAVAF